MTDLDQQIRAELSSAGWRDLADAIRAVLDLPPMRTAGTGVRDQRDQRAQTAEWLAAGYNQALADVRVEIADRLGIQPPQDGADWRSPADLGPARGMPGETP